MCSIDGASDKICCSKEEITEVKDKDLGLDPLAPTPDKRLRLPAKSPKGKRSLDSW